MQTSTRERGKIKEWEGWADPVSDDGFGNATGGWGHIKGVTNGQRVTPAQGEVWLTEDLRFAEDAVNRLVSVPLTQGQFDVLISFTMNLGSGALEVSTLRKKLNAGDYASVRGELLRWDHVGPKQVAGLTRRRQDEANDWTMYSAPVNPIDPSGSRTINGGVVAGAGGAVVVAEQANEAITSASWHLGAGNTIGLVIGLLILAGAAWAIYARLDDAGKLPWHRAKQPEAPVPTPLPPATPENP